MARQGAARPGLAWRCKARAAQYWLVWVIIVKKGAARQGPAGQGLAWPGAARLGEA